MKRKYLESSCLFVLILMFLAVIFPAGAFAQSETKTIAATADESVMGVAYRGHVQNYGNVPTPEGTMIAGPEALGTKGEGLRLEGFWIDLTGDVPANAGISYQVHVQNIGWQDVVNSGDFAGTNARGLRIEAIKISLENLPDYDVYYRGHVQNVGNIPQIDGNWGWVKNGEELGTTSRGLRLEELQIKIVRKGIDLTAYNTLLNTIEKLDAANYSPESWATLQTALTDNKMTEANSQTSIDAATQAIQAAYDALSLKVVAVYDKPGVYGPETGTQTIEGSVIIDVSGVTLQNLVIKGDLTVSEAVGDGDATLNNLTVEGTTVLGGGGTGGATLTGLATSGEMTLAENSGGITIDGGDYNRVQISKKDNGGIQIIMKNNVTGNIEIIDAPEGQPIILKGQFKGIGILAPDIKLDLLPGTTIGTIIAGSGNPYLISAAGLDVTGSGTVDNFTIYQTSSNVNVGAGINVGYATIDGGNATFNGAVGTAYINGKNAVFGSTVKSAIIFDNSNSFAVAPGSSLGIYPPNIVSKPTPPGGGGPVLSSDATISDGTLAGNVFSGTFTGGASIGVSSALTVTVADAAKTNAALALNKSNANSVIKYVKGAQPTSHADYTSTYTAGSTQITVANGDIIWLLVTAQDGTTKKYYKVTVTVSAPLSDVATITYGTLAGNAIAGTFTGGDSIGASDALTVTVADVAKTDAALYLHKSNDNSVVKYVIGTQPGTDAGYTSTYTNGAAGFPQITVADNDIIWLMVTAEDGITKKYYKVTVTVLPSDDATISGGTLSGNAIAGTFTGGDSIGASDALTVTVADAAKTDAELFLTKGNANSVIKYVKGAQPTSDYDYETTYSDGSTLITVANGDIIWLFVTAEDGTTKKYYKVTVTVLPSDDATISGGTLSGNAIAGTFTGGDSIGASDALTVTVADVAKTDAELFLTKGNANSVIKYVKGAQPTSDYDYETTYSDGSTLITVANGDIIWLFVTAEDGTTKKYYKVTVS